jgi:hypothetical protein
MRVDLELIEDIEVKIMGKKANKVCLSNSMIFLSFHNIPNLSFIVMLIILLFDDIELSKLYKASLYKMKHFCALGHVVSLLTQG